MPPTRQTLQPQTHPGWEQRTEDTPREQQHSSRKDGGTRHTSIGSQSSEQGIIGTVTVKKLNSAGVNKHCWTQPPRPRPPGAEGLLPAPSHGRDEPPRPALCVAGRGPQLSRQTSAVFGNAWPRMPLLVNTMLLHMGDAAPHSCEMNAQLTLMLGFCQVGSVTRLETPGKILI